MKATGINNITIVPISEKGLDTAHIIQRTFATATICEFHSFDEERFKAAEAIVFIGAMGICVRTIAPFLKNKHIDPAVICIESSGRYIIPVASGHVGGANQLSKEMAHTLGGEAIITTQSDNSDLWALDTLGEEFSWHMVSHSSVRKPALTVCISTFVNQRPTALLLDIRDKGTDYLERTHPEHVKIFYHYEEIDFSQFELFISVGPFEYEAPISHIAYYPEVLHLGFGCRKNMEGDSDELFKAIKNTLNQRHLSIFAVKDIATIDIKKDEPILNTLCNENKWNKEIITYTSDELQNIKVPNPSMRVKEATDSPSVSEAAAISASGNGILLIEKQKLSLGIGKEFTLAVAMNRQSLRKGHIEIVGAGPGDPELISVRGKNMLEKADLILYAGSLVPIELTFYAKNGATVKSSADMNLEEQFELMKEFYDAGKFVVRLHTGDPCIYGAIQEQMAFFDKYDMDYHITPGISSFQAAAAALNSQFTIPEKTQTIILTRGEGRTPMPEREQLHKLAASQSTMCIFLSAAIVEDVQKELLTHYSPETPVAACYKLTWKDERIYRGELKDLAKIVKENHLTLTTLLVVGDAIDNRQGLSRLYADEFKHLFRK